MTVQGSDGVDHHAHGHQRDPRRRLGAADDPRLRGRRPDHDLRRGPHARLRAEERGRHRRRCHRLRVRLHLRRPRRQGHDPRVPAQDPPRAATTTWPTWWCGPSGSGASRSARAPRSSATSPRPRARRCSVEGGDPVETDVVVVSVGRRPFADQLGLVGTAVKVDQRGFVEVDELCRTGEPGVYALGDLINTPQLAHVGFAEAIMVDQAHPRRAAAAGHVRPRAVGHLLPPRGRLRRLQRGGGQGGRLRRRHVEAPVPGQQPGPHHR